MKNGQKFLLGMVTGAAAVLAGTHVVRSRRAIGFAGRVVVITGGSRGLGLVMARQLAAEGAHLCLLARDEEELAAAREELAGSAGEILTISCDIRRRADVRAAIDTVLERWTSIDVLINNAGVIQVGPLEHMTTQDFENAMATHFWGPLHLMFESVPSMRRRGFGRIVNITSIGGRVAVPHLAPYCASKFALVGLSDAVRAELGQYGIRVTTVTPGLMRTGSPVNVDVKGKHEAEYSVVRDFRFPARALCFGRTGRGRNHRGVPLRRFGADDYVAGPDRDGREQCRSAFRGPRNGSGQSAAAGTERG